MEVVVFSPRWWVGAEGGLVECMSCMCSWKWAGDVLYVLQKHVLIAASLRLRFSVRAFSVCVAYVYTRIYIYICVCVCVCVCV